MAGRKSDSCTTAKRVGPGAAASAALICRAALSELSECAVSVHANQVNRKTCGRLKCERRQSERKNLGSGGNVRGYSAGNLL